MPKEVFAEEIERFLGTIDGVAAVRVFPTPGGEIARVYVTAEPTADARAVRRGVAAALVSTYGIPIELWRIQVTQPRSGLRLGELPRFRVLRIEETISATEVTASVQVAWVRGGDDRVATGRARGPVGSVHRLRALASATVEAAREALDPAHRRITVQQASLVTFLDRPTVLVGVSILTPRGPEISLGVAHDDASSEAVVAAALDAILKWVLRAAFAESAPPAGDRRARLEAIRRQVQAATSGEAPAAPASASPGAPPGPHGAAGRRPQERGPAAASRLEIDAATGAAYDPEVASGADPTPETGEDPPEHPSGAPEPGGGITGASVGGVLVGRPAGSPDPDVVWDVREIRPEERGVAAMASRSESPNPAGGSVEGGRLAARPSMEDAFYQPLIANHTPVHIRCQDGYEIPSAVLREAGTYSLLFEADGGVELVYKHAIVSIRPLTDRSAKA